jgi:SAM-dependent methyltransferase
MGFSKVSDQYERARPGYPPAVVEWIGQHAGLGPGSVVVDLAAGTGKLTRVLTGTGARVIAVEPIDEMRAQLTAMLPEVEALAGTAEEMGLPDGSADAVTVGQAFHWFATDEALAEIARVLRPGGLLALVWNERDLGQPLQADIRRIQSPYEGDTPAHLSGAWRQVMSATPLFEPAGELHMKTEQQLDEDGLVERVASTSFIANLPVAERASVLGEVRQLVPASEAVTLCYDTVVYGYRKADMDTLR